MEGDYPETVIVLMHEIFSHDYVRDTIAGVRARNYSFITAAECLERCIQRDYDSQPAHLADVYGCWDSHNPTDYSAPMMIGSQPWLRRSYPDMPTEPTSAPTSEPTLAPPTSMPTDPSGKMPPLPVFDSMNGAGLLIADPLTVASDASVDVRTRVVPTVHR